MDILQHIANLPIEIVAQDRVLATAPAERFLIPFSDNVKRADPLLCKTRDDTVCLLSQGWLAGSNPEGLADSPGIPWLLKSADRGESWELIPFETTPAGGNVQAFGILRDGTMLVTFEAPVPEGITPWRDELRAKLHESNPELNRSLNGYFVSRSTDGGQTWTAGEEIDSRPFHSLSSLSIILELPDGTLLLTANGRYGTHTIDITTGERLPPEKTGIFEHVLRSTDGGRTWPERHPLVTHAAETRLFRLPSGRILASIRAQSPFLDEPPLAGATIGSAWDDDDGHWMPAPGVDASAKQSGQKRMWIAESDDDGRTWNRLRQAVFGGEESPGEIHRLDDGRLLLITGDRGDPGGIWAHVSNDDSRTWDPRIVVLRRYEPPRSPDYPSSVIFDDGTILTMTGLNQHNPAVAVRWQMPKDF